MILRIFIIWILLVTNNHISHGSVVPNIVHFVHLNGGEIPLYVYLNLLSAIHNIKPIKTYFHYIIEPEGWFWIRLKNFNNLDLIKHDDKSINIYGHYPKSNDWAHKSDIIRLDMLKEYGGIYIDTDVLILKSFDNFLDYEFTMGDWRKPPLELILCNAIVISAPNSKFLQSWREGYINADFKCWDCQSTVYPTELARNGTYRTDGSDGLYVAPAKAFYPIDWLGPSSKFLFDETLGEKKFKSPFNNIYAQHLWNARHKGILRKLTPSKVCKLQSLYGHMLRFALNGTDFYRMHCKSNKKIIKKIQIEK